MGMKLIAPPHFPEPKNINEVRSNHVYWANERAKMSPEEIGKGTKRSELWDKLWKEREAQKTNAYRQTKAEARAHTQGRTNSEGTPEMGRKALARVGGSNRKQHRDGGPSGFSKKQARGFKGSYSWTRPDFDFDKAYASAARKATADFRAGTAAASKLGIVGAIGLGGLGAYGTYKYLRGKDRPQENKK